MEQGGWLKQSFNRWLWLGPVLAMLVAAAVLMMFGLKLWAALAIALLLVCPALIIWGAVTVRHTLWGRPDAR